MCHVKCLQLFLQEFIRRQRIALLAVQEESARLIQLSHIRQNELMEKSNKVQRARDRETEREATHGPLIGPFIFFLLIVFCQINQRYKRYEEYSRMKNEEVTCLQKSLDEELARCSRKCDNLSRSIQQKEQGREGE